MVEFGYSNEGNVLSAKGYLPLNEYSAKYHISLSTLRRRIRAGEIEYRFESGKYWLKELPPTKYGHPVSFEETTGGIPAEFVASTPTISTVNDKPAIAQTLAATPAPQAPTENLLVSAKQMMQEIKSAYVSVLHEKEEQIMHLKEEVADLKTLVKILESEADRLRANSLEAAPIDSWLEENT